MRCCRQPSGRPAVTVASFTTSAEQDTLRQLAQARARIETLETQVVRLQAEVSKLRHIVQPLSPDLIERLTSGPGFRTPPRYEHKQQPSP